MCECKCKNSCEYVGNLLKNGSTVIEFSVAIDSRLSPEEMLEYVRVVAQRRFTTPYMFEVK